MGPGRPYRPARGCSARGLGGVGACCSAGRAGLGPAWGATCPLTHFHLPQCTFGLPGLGTGVSSPKHFIPPGDCRAPQARVLRPPFRGPALTWTSWGGVRGEGAACVFWGVALGLGVLDAPCCWDGTAPRFPRRFSLTHPLASAQTGGMDDGLAWRPWFPGLLCHPHTPKSLLVMTAGWRCGGGCICPWGPQEGRRRCWDWGGGPPVCRCRPCMYLQAWVCKCGRRLPCLVGACWGARASQRPGAGLGDTRKPARFVGCPPSPATPKPSAATNACQAPECQPEWRPVLSTPFSVVLGLRGGMRTQKSPQGSEGTC